MTNIEDLERRLERLENLEAIRELHRKYIYFVNNQQWDDVIHCFTPDATVDIARHGLHKRACGSDEAVQKENSQNQSKMERGSFYNPADYLG